MIDFPKRVLFLGYGAVAQCALPIFVKHFRVPLANVTILDLADRSETLRPWTAQGVRFFQRQITPENLGSELAKHLSAGDLLVDLAWNIDCCEILAWCHEHGVLYINTSVEVWDPYTGATGRHPTERTLYWRHMNVRRLAAGWSEPGPTAIIEHGANPGLISHWTKQGLIDIAEKLLDGRKVEGPDAEEIGQLVKDRTFNRLAMKLGVKVIHCSERDTQITNQPKQVDEFLNTWSIEGLHEEGITTAEMGWGSHEKELPPLAYEHSAGPRNQICLARMGINTWVVSWVPHYCIRGMVVRHGEAFTISDRLTVWEDGRAVYRPTVHYAYCPCDSCDGFARRVARPRLRPAIETADHGRRDHRRGRHPRALLMGHAYNSWWTGSLLSIEESRRLVPHQNATTMQVAIAAVAAATWMVHNPDRGVCVPDDLPHDYVLGVARPYLGESLSIPTDWTPLENYLNNFCGYNQPNIDWDDPWQFKNFLVTDGD